jgi:hypothetical protein
LNRTRLESRRQKAANYTCPKCSNESAAQKIVSIAFT